MVIGKSLDKYHHFLNLPLLVTILFFHDWDPSILYFNLTNKNFTEKDIVCE